MNLDTTHEFFSSAVAVEYLKARGWTQKPGTQVYTSDDFAGARVVLKRHDSTTLSTVSHYTGGNKYHTSYYWKIHII